ncbi:MAG TPA: hypothetical protein VFO94_07720 [Gammaproteobacteria bacterium]|nr:hypothetical protein [Gammaproteobacteria bacterium]
MKTPLLYAAAIAAAMLTQPALAQQPASPAPQTAPAPSEVDAQVAKMQALMTQMNDQMSKLAQTTDPTERQKLMQEHWTTMQSAMTLMQDAWGGGKGGPMMGPMMHWNDFSKMTPEQRAQHQYMMERWMPMQQMMMGHMMQHQGMMQPQAPTPAQ